MLTDTHLGGFDSLSGRCIYNLRLVHKMPLEGLEIKCRQLCSGTNTGADGSLFPCDYFVDSEDYYQDSCAWNVRAKKLRNRIIAKHGKFSQGFLQPAEDYCLSCNGTIDSDCQGYFNVRDVVDELCAHKSEIKIKLKKRVSLQGLETNCKTCLGKVNCRNCEDGFYSSRDLFEFKTLFLPVNSIPESIPNHSLYLFQAST